MASPALPGEEGAPLRAVGVGNTRITFARNFVELVTVAGHDGGCDEDGDTALVPLQASAEPLPRLRAGISHAAARITSALQRFEGLHIVVFGTDDADAAAERLTADGPPRRSDSPVPAGHRR